MIAFLVVTALMLALLDRNGAAAAQCRRLAAHVFKPGQKLSQKAMLVIREQAPDIRLISDEEKQLEFTRLQLHEARAIVAQQAARINELERSQRIMQQILGQLPEYPLDVIPAHILSPSYVDQGGGYRIDSGSKQGVCEGQFVLYPYISRGRTSGVRDGQAVVTGKGVVGIIAHADTDFSEVRLVTSPDCRLSARIVHWDVGSRKWVAAPEVGRLTGSDDKTSMVMELVRSNVDVAPGDYVVTYSAGIGIADSMILGEVTSVEPGKGGLTHRIIVRPRIDFGRLDEVYVLTPRSREFKK
ncbi:MAG: rod shape-determining protein MreC [Planctomycetes bacterium]|nr:rod shape-determining protein MreC [Planctomycetota bacterium]